MINKKSKTLRDFTLRITDKKGNKFIIRYGYDMSNVTSGHYLNASINGSEANSTAATLSKVKALRIPAITKLIDAIGRDVTGTPVNYIEEATKLLSALETKPNDENMKNLLDFYQISKVTERKSLIALVEKYLQTSQNARSGLLNRYLMTRRVTFITNQKALIKSLRELYIDGATVDGKKVLPKICGYLSTHPYHHYYKRDVDYIRKSRVKLFRDTLKRNYTAVN